MSTIPAVLILVRAIRMSVGECVGKPPGIHLGINPGGLGGGHNFHT